MAELKQQIVKHPRFSAKWLKSIFHDLMWVTLISVLIWMYSDMEFTDSRKFSATLVLNTGLGKDIVLLSPSENKINFELAGSQSQLENYRKKLQLGDGRIELDISEYYSKGSSVVPAEELLNQACKFSDMGLLIKDIDQKAITLRMDALEKMPDVNVELDAIGANLENVPSQKINIYAPASKIETLKQKLGDKPIVLKTKLVDLKGHQPGKHTVTAEVIPVVSDIAVIPDRKELQFDVNIINPVETREMAVPVQILTPSAWSMPDDTTWKEYVLVRQTPAQWRPKVIIAGESKDLNPANIHAFVQLTDDDKKPIESWISKDVMFDFAPGSNLKLVGPAPKVMFRLEKRKPLLTTPGG